jgi:predicted ArsR family transcriptional regulator
MSTVPHPESSDLRSVDRQLLLALRKGDCVGIGELTDALGVTATAVRQRIERLLEQDLIEREKLVAGRGRPTFRYRLTVAGHQRAGANPVELVDAMWREIVALPDDAVRSRLLDSVAGRLGQRFAEELNQSTKGEDNLATPIAGSDDENAVAFERRVHKLSEALVSRHIESEVSHDGELPVLDIGTCPYPSLTNVSDDRAMCRLEEKMFSEALGRPMHLSSCRLDGDACCQFSPTSSSTPNHSTTQVKPRD